MEATSTPAVRPFRLRQTRPRVCAGAEASRLPKVTRVLAMISTGIKREKFSPCRLMPKNVSSEACRSAPRPPAAVRERGACAPSGMPSFSPPVYTPAMAADARACRYSPLSLRRHTARLKNAPFMFDDDARQTRRLPVLRLTILTPQRHALPPAPALRQPASRLGRPAVAAVAQPFPGAIAAPMPGARQAQPKLAPGFGLPRVLPSVRDAHEAAIPLTRARARA